MSCDVNKHIYRTIHDMKLTSVPGFSDLGIYVDNLDFQNLSVEEWVELKNKLYSKYLLIIFRNANLSLKDFTSRVSQWGEKSYGLRYFLRKYDISVEKFSTIVNDIHMMFEYGISIDDIDIILSSLETIDELTDNKAIVVKLSGINENKDPKFLEGELKWHKDESMDIAFSDVIALYGNKNMTKSATGFLTTNKWYEEQTESFRSELDGMIAIHNYKPQEFNDYLDPKEESIVRYSIGFDNQLPLVINSGGGFKGLHYSLNTITGIVGMTNKESKSLLDYINKTLFVESRIYDHWYQQDNDLLIFDNSISLHRRLGSTVNRVAYRSPFYFHSPIVSRYLQPEFQEKYRSIMSKYN